MRSFGTPGIEYQFGTVALHASFTGLGRSTHPRWTVRPVVAAAVLDVSGALVTLRDAAPPSAEACRPFLPSGRPGSRLPSDRTRQPVRRPTDVSVSDHVRSIGTDHPDGVYRVVGRREGGLTLLRVTDADGARRHTGELVTVSRHDFDGSVAVDAPRRERTPRSTLTSVLGLLYWSVRVFGSQLRAHPVPTALAVALVAVGFLGGRLSLLADPVSGVLILLGSLALAFVGSGRLR